jgi:hypothetical protein
MKSKFTGFLLFYFFFVLSVHSQPPGTTYGKILFRVNAGGTEVNSKDTSTVKWGMDHMLAPCPYIDTNVVGNKTYTIPDTIIFNPSVPPNTPVQVFKSERGLDAFKPATIFDWNFNIPAATKVEVRLYFAEIWFSEANKRKFDVQIEGSTVLSDYDIFAEAGSKVGVMKSFIATSDGTLDIDFIKVLQIPKINAIEIIELNDAGALATLNAIHKNRISAYPNPFKDIVSFENLNSTDISLIQIYNAYGKITDTNINYVSGVTSINLSQYPAGTYFIHIETNKGDKETIRIIKQ